MRIDYTQTNLLSGVPNSFAFCPCNGADTQCSACEGKGHIFLPFVCLNPGCEEGFLDLAEYDEHTQKAHGMYPIQFD